LPPAKKRARPGPDPLYGRWLVVIIIVVMVMMTFVAFTLLATMSLDYVGMAEIMPVMGAFSVWRRH